MSDQLNICMVLVTNIFDAGNPAYTAIQNLIDIYTDVSKQFFIIGPRQTDLDRSKVKHISVPRARFENRLLNILTYMLYQAFLAKTLYNKRNDIDVVFFHLGGGLLIIPILICKLCKLPCAIFITGSIYRSYRFLYGKNFLTRTVIFFIKIIQKMSHTLCDLLIFPSANMLSFEHVNSNKNIFVANWNFIDTNLFKKEKNICERSIDLIYVGRFEKVKGIKKFTFALPVLINKYPNLNVELVGDGHLKPYIEHYLNHENISDKIMLTGWIPLSAVAQKLKNSRFLIIPSESEGLPKILLQAMACGTIPISTPVGGVPDVIDDGVNGFLIGNNTSECISESIERFLNRKDLEQLSRNAATSIKEEYSFEATTKKYRTILENLGVLNV